MKLMNNTIKVSYYQNGIHFTGVRSAQPTKTRKPLSEPNHSAT